MYIFYLRMNGFSTETAGRLQTLQYSVLTGVANAYYAPMIHIINCSEVFTKSFAFQESILIYSVQICRQVPPKHFWLREMYCYSFTSEKTYLVIQTWLMVKWFRYPCHDVDCYPCLRGRVGSNRSCVDINYINIQSSWWVSPTFYFSKHVFDH